MTTQRPNIILILADDMGYSDIGCYGGEIDTPNIDALAGSGIRFTQMYNTARCCPSRASLLTGLNPHQTGVGHMVSPIENAPAYQGYLNDNCATLAEVLGDAGYRTGISGKWHTGGDPARSEEGLPQFQRGFEQVFWFEGGNGYFNHTKFHIDGETVDASGSDYLTDMISDHAVRMINDISNDDRPLFLHVAYTSPHWPLQALERDIANCRGRYDGGWDVQRAERFERMREMGIIDSQWAMSPRDETVAAWSDVEHKEWESLRMAVYAAQVERMDQGIGRIVDALRHNGALDDTLIIFLSDNGGCAEFLYEDSNSPDPSRVIPLTRDGREVKVGNSPDITPGGDDSYMSYDTQWANVSNTPFRRYKRWTHEGGIATPLVVSWPNRIGQTSGQGRIEHTPIQLMDVTATCIDVASARYPKERRGHDIIPLEGESFGAVLDGNSWQKSKPLAWEHEGNQAIRVGDWKLVREAGRPWELYNLSRDRTELDDLSAGEGDRVAELSGMYAEWMARAQVGEWPPGDRGSWQFPGMNDDGTFNMRGRGHIIPRTFVRAAADAGGPDANTPPTRG